MLSAGGLGVLTSGGHYAAVGPGAATGTGCTEGGGACLDVVSELCAPYLPKRHLPLLCCPFSSRHLPSAPLPDSLPPSHRSLLTMVMLTFEAKRLESLGRGEKKNEQTVTTRDLISSATMP